MRKANGRKWEKSQTAKMLLALPHTANSTCHCRAAALISRNKREILRFNKTELFSRWDLILKTIASGGILRHWEMEGFNPSLRKIFEDERLLIWSDVIWIVEWGRGWHWAANPVSVYCQSVSLPESQAEIKPPFSTISVGALVTDQICKFVVSYSSRPSPLNARTIFCTVARCNVKIRFTLLLLTRLLQLYKQICISAFIIKPIKT